MNEDRTLDPAEEARLEAELVRLRGAVRSTGAAKDPLVRVVRALEGLDRVDDGAVERHVDTLYEEYASTTRSRGVLDFCAQAFHRSVLVKVVAASIAVHLVALPVVAYMLFVPEEEGRARIVFDLNDRTAPPVFDRIEEELNLEDAFDHVLASDRELLLDLATSQSVTAPDPDSLTQVERLLWLRIESWTSGAPALARGATRAHDDLRGWRVEAGATDPLASALRLELALDLMLLAPGGREWFEREVGELVEVLARPAEADGDANAVALLEGALARARQYGLVEGGARDHKGLDLSVWLARVERALGAPLPGDLAAAFERLTGPRGR